MLLLASFYTWENGGTHRLSNSFEQVVRLQSLYSFPIKSQKPLYHSVDTEWAFTNKNNNSSNSITHHLLRAPSVPWTMLIPLPTLFHLTLKHTHTHTNYKTDPTIIPFYEEEIEIIISIEIIKLK